MRRPETVARLARAARAVLALASLGGCARGARLSPDAGSAHYAAASPSRAAPSEAVAARSSHGSPKFGDFVRAREPQLQFCYAEARKKHPELTGSATVAVTLVDAGGVASATVVRRSWAGKGGNDVERCVLAKVQAWQFPPVDPQDPHVHSFAMIFSK